MKKTIQLTLFLFLALLFQNCQDEEFTNEIVTEIPTNLNLNDQIFQSENFGNATTGNFIGLVKDTEGIKLENVQITIGNIVTMTDRNGMFILNTTDVFENFAYIKAKKDGYIDASRVVIPKTDGASKINIIMFKKEVIATVSSGQNSQVSTPSGALVNFSGGFITADGSPYSGNVDVVMHNIQPSSARIFAEMPGSLLAQNASNNAQSLETYGMISINLFSPSGERLNIDPESPATLEFPIYFTQNGIAPETIDLWYFDEEVGYWKEEGQAVRDGNKYVAEVTHFTWWNCDIPFDSVEFCFTASATNVDGDIPYFVIIRRVSNDQIIYSGEILGNETECGLVPRNEEISVSIYGTNGFCNTQLVHAETLGGYATDTSVNITFTENNLITNIVGIANNCIGDPITNGYMYINDSNIFSITDGVIDIGVSHCTTEVVTLQIFDYDTSQWMVADNVLLDGGNFDVGTVSSCTSTGGIYNGDVTLFSQSDVNEFGAQNFTTINGNLTIGDYQFGSNITNLTPLNLLENVDEFLTISNNPNLISLDGLSNVTSANLLVIDNNASLNSISSLSSLTSLEFGFRISNNNALTSLDGLENVNATANLNVTLVNNPVLASLDPLQSYTVANGINISNCQAISSLAPLSNLTSFSTVDLSFLPLLTSLQGLNQLTNASILRIRDVDALTDISALSNVTSASIVSIGGNDALTNLDGLENLLSVDWMLIGKDIEFDIVVNSPNTNLTNFCALQNLFTNGTYPTTTSTFSGIYIENNPFNPSIQNIIDGNCSQ
ncbi:leucine-rich repeat domain-containing protein [Kordia jejudonensis]|uniref:leucine-rich repeat domain-containing protein n=1 Tax=Kordia jejudonensis TaxID=1348245 RepID=UPI00062905AE|nr:leucine-rich repeat domain-containing protein [Kordia jejudonensis]